MELCGIFAVNLSISFSHAFSWLAAWASFSFYAVAKLFLHYEIHIEH